MKRLVMAPSLSAENTKIISQYEQTVSSYRWGSPSSAWSRAAAGAGPGRRGRSCPAPGTDSSSSWTLGSWETLETATCPHPPGQNPRHPALLFPLRLHLDLSALVRPRTGKSEHVSAFNSPHYAGSGHPI